MRQKTRERVEKAGFADLEAVRAREADAQREVRQAGQELIAGIGAEIPAPKGKKKEEPQIHVEAVKPSGGLPSTTPKPDGRQSSKERAMAKILKDSTEELERAKIAIAPRTAPPVRTGKGATVVAPKAKPTKPTGTAVKRRGGKGRALLQPGVGVAGLA